MKADITKDTFNVTKHFSRVLMQQGRVQLDADWNEQAGILLHYIQTLAKDLIGEHAGPKGNAAFEISEVSDTDFKIGLGNYYVDGILCENEGGSGNAPYKYTNQPYYRHVAKLLENGAYLVYLDVWEHLFTHLEDESIREVALLGADTTARAKIIWQVKIENVMVEEEKIGNLSNTELKNLGEIINNVWPRWKKLWQPECRGLLKAKAKQADAQSEPCNIQPDSCYRGLENQLYRVEIHQGGKLSDEYKPTFKWSRDNGSTVSRATLNSKEALSLDNPQGFSSGNWVELTTDEQEVRGESGLLLKINKVDEDILYFDAEVVRPTLPAGENWPTKARLWNRAAIEIAEGRGEDKWLVLEDGVQIQFQPSISTTLVNQYRTGDYWLIPARVATGNIDWPIKDGKPLALDPHGVKHHYAPLAIVKKDHSVQNLRIEF